MPSLIAPASWRDIAERQMRRSRTRTMTQLVNEIVGRNMQIVGLTIRFTGPGEKPRIGTLAIAILLAHLAIAYPAWAESPAAQSNDLAPVSDAKAVTTDTDQGLQKPTDLGSLCQTIASA